MAVLRQWETDAIHHLKCLRPEMLHPLPNQGHHNGDVVGAWASLSLLSGQKFTQTKMLNLYILKYLLTG